LCVLFCVRSVSCGGSDEGGQRFSCLWSLESCRPFRQLIKFYGALGELAWDLHNVVGVKANENWGDLESENDVGKIGVKLSWRFGKLM
jgi:hypothetical protein